MKNPQIPPTLVEGEPGLRRKKHPGFRMKTRNEQVQLVEQVVVIFLTCELLVATAGWMIMTTMERLGHHGL